MTIQAQLWPGGEFVSVLVRVLLFASAWRASTCWAVGAGEVKELQQLCTNRQYEEAVAYGFPSYRRLVSEKLSHHGVRELGLFLAGSFEAYKRASQGMRHAACRPRIGPRRIRDEVERYYRGAAELALGRPIDFSGLDDQSQAFLKLFRRCYLLSHDSKLGKLFNDCAASVADMDTKLALADYVLVYMLLTRADDQMVQDLGLLPQRVGTSPQLAEFASFLARVGRSDAACKVYEAAAQKESNPEVAVAYLKKRAELLVQLKEVSNAIEAYKYIVNNYRRVSGAADAQVQVVKLLAFEWKSYGAAITECRRLIELFPGSPQAELAEFMIAQMYYLDHDYDNAIAVLNAALEKDSKSGWVVNAKLLLGLSYVGRRNNDKAVEVLRSIVRDYPAVEAGARAQFLIGYVYLTEQDYAKALAEFQELVHSFPRSKDAAQARRYIERLGGIVKEPK